MASAFSRAKSRFSTSLLVAAGLSITVSQADAEDRNFAAGSLIIPMDQSYQDSGMLQSYGLRFQLLRQRIDIQTHSGREFEHGNTLTQAVVNGHEALAPGAVVKLVLCFRQRGIHSQNDFGSFGI